MLDTNRVRKTPRPLDADDAKGAVEQDRPEQTTNTDGLREQIEHRDYHSVHKDFDTDFPEPGLSPEYSMQKQDKDLELNDKQKHPDRDPDGNAEGRLNDQDPGERQKRNQNDKTDDPLAAETTAKKRKGRSQAPALFV